LHRTPSIDAVSLQRLLKHSISMDHHAQSGLYARLKQLHTARYAHSAKAQTA